MVSDGRTSSNTQTPHSGLPRSQFSRREWLARKLLKEFVSGYGLIPGQPPIVIYVLAFSFAVLAVIQFPIGSAPRIEIFQTAVPGAAAVFLAVCGYWVSLAARPAQKQAAGVLMGVLLMAVATGTVAMVLVLEAGELRGTFDWLFGFTAAMSAGAIVGVPIGFGFDSLAAYQQSLEAEHRQTRQLNQQLRVLNRVMRHNVRNELTVALGGLQFIEPDLETDQSRDWYRRAIRSLERLHTHTEKLIRLDSEGLFGVATTTVDIAAFTRVYLAGDAVGPPGDHVTIDAPETARVAAHPLIGSAVAEALHNAWIHADTPNITVDISVQSSTDQVTVEVADTGPGIPAIELRALDRADEAPLAHGQGVGLWFIKWVVDASDGTLSFDSNEPRGTIVRMQLPHAEPT
ncbi:sensor histidine kinase [Halomicroarcula sp. GCM10025817]|uniref:sensor histidine kinase n=1 Tax=Haloarcula TaxID=2237 RepID=UPI0023E7EF26|nr:HAMP domain-containing sensor histidine kinase [Halomicroarcula sp. SYNS111]